MNVSLPDFLTLEERMILYGWFYKLGSPIVSDKKYNQLYKELRTLNPESVVISKTWSELEEPFELLEKANLIALSRNLSEQNSEDDIEERFFMPKKNMELRSLHYSEAREHFSHMIPKSIDTIESLPESERWFKEMKGESEYLQINGSLKIDGWFSDLYYYDDYFVGAHTRGRSDGDARDITIALSHVVPLKINTGKKFVKVSCESAMLKSSLEILRKKDTTREWKNPRNSMSTLLLNNLTKDFYQYIVPFALNIEGVQFESASDRYYFLQEQGFTVTPNVTVEVSSSDQIIALIENRSKYTVDIPSDGFVIQVDDRESFSEFETSGKYDNAIKAYRMYEWSSQIFVTMVTDFLFPYGAREITMGLKVFPVEITNSRTVHKLDADNLDRVLRSGVQIGSLVAFQTRSDSYVDWIDFSTNYFDKCIEHDIPMEPSFAQALMKFKKELEDKMGMSLPELMYTQTNALEYKTE